MRVLIFALLALAVNATNYRYGGNYYGGSPSYSYSSYPSSYYGGYGSSLYGAGYGSSLYGAGYGAGYGSGIGYGTGASYYTSYKPSYHTARYVYGQPHTTGVEYSTKEAPGNIAFTLGDTSYQTGTPVISSYENWKTPVATKGVFHQGTTSVVGVQGETAPGKISFTQDFSKTSGHFDPIAPAVIINENRYSHQRPRTTGGAYRSSVPGNIAFALGGAGYQTGYQKWKSPVAIRHSTPNAFGVGYLHQKRGHGAKGGIPAVGVQEIAGIGEHVSEDDIADVSRSDFSEIGGQVSGVEFAGDSYGKISSPVGVDYEKPKGVLGHRTPSIRQSGAVAPGKITFTQDFSGLSGHQRSGGNTGVSSFKKAIVPARVVTERRPYGGGAVGTIRGQPMSFTQDFSKVRGQFGIAPIKPEVHGYDRVVVPVRAAVAPRIPSRRYGSSGAIRPSGFLGTTGGQPQIRFTQGLPKITGQTHQFGIKPEVVAPFVGSVSQTPVRRVSESFSRNKAQGLSAAGPSRISFTQDFSRVAGHQTSGIKPIVSTVHRSTGAAFPRVVPTGGFQTFAAPKPVPKLQFKAPKQPVVSQEPAVTEVIEQIPAHGAFGGFTGHVADKPVVATGPAIGFSGDYKQEIVTVDEHVADQRPNTFNVLRTGTIKDKLSAYKHSNLGRTEDISNKFVVIPTYSYDEEKPSVLLHAPGVNPADSYVEEKGSVFHVSSKDAGSDYLKPANLDQGVYSSSYPGYSHVSGESPRFDFSHDRSLLYTYDSPILGSPFAYTYSSGKGQYAQIYKKA